MATATNHKYKTRNDLKEDLRNRMESLLNAALADAIDLQLQSKQAHWNVKGPDFIALHKLFDEVHEAVTEYVDMLAERVVQLGGTADGTIGHVSKQTRLTAYSTHLSNGKEHVEALANALATFGKHIRKTIGETTEDAGTNDMFIEISRGIDKWLWFVEAHLQAER